jgi:bis(5'-nucleosyl)-tetraphosphatase (symmetrical)
MLADMYGDAPDRWSEDLSGADRLRFTVNCFTRLRFVDRKGRLLLAYKGSVADAPAGSIPWFRHPERATRGDALVFGHWSALGFVAEPGLRGLDTGCVWGGALTAIRLDRNDMQPVRLPCRRRAPR